MGMPPDNIKPSELFQKIIEMPRPSKVVDFPRKDPLTGKTVGQLRMWVLNQGEMMAAQSAATTFAHDLATEHGKKKLDLQERVEGYEQLYKNALCVELLFRACRDVENINLPIFPTPFDLRQKLTIDECSVLAESYAVVQNELGPIASDLSNEEMDAWLERLAIGGSAAPLAFATSGLLRDLLMRSAHRLYPSATDTSSPTQPPDESTQNDSESSSKPSEPHDDSPAESVQSV